VGSIAFHSSAELANATSGDDLSFGLLGELLGDNNAGGCAELAGTEYLEVAL